MVQILIVLLLLVGSLSAQVLQPKNGGTGNSTAGSAGQIPISDGTKFNPADPLMSGPDANGAAPTKGPVLLGGWDGTDVRIFKTDSSGILQMNGGAGTVTSFSSGSLSPYFTTSVATSTTTPALSFSGSNAAADTVLSNFTGSPAVPAFNAIPNCSNDGSHALVYSTSTHNLTCVSITAGTGSVTSVGIAMPSTFSVSGTPVTASGTLTAAYSVAGADYVVTSTASNTAAFEQVNGGSSCGDSTHAVSYDTATHKFGCQAISTGSAGALILLEQHTATSSATLDFTTAITSTYDEYVIEVVRIVPASNATSLRLQVSTDGGSTWDTTSGHYGWSVFVMVSNATGPNGNDSDTAMSLGVSISSTATDGGYNGSFRLFDPLNASNDKVVAGSGGGYLTSNSKISAYSVAGRYAQTTAINALRFLMSSGNIASGTIRVYGIAK